MSLASVRSTCIPNKNQATGLIDVTMTYTFAIMKFFSGLSPDCIVIIALYEIHIKPYLELMPPRWWQVREAKIELCGP